MFKLAPIGLIDREKCTYFLMSGRAFQAESTHRTE